jgi:glycosyltransferase involved in cell wall biosynthesis
MFGAPLQCSPAPAAQPAGRKVRCTHRMTTIYVNGKFLAQRLTGVQRFATELLKAVDQLLAQAALNTGPRWVLLYPHGTTPPSFRRISTLAVHSAGAPLHLWEQSALPWAARSGLLLNLAGSAPWFAARQVCSFHDAAVFDQPQAYTATFRRWYRALFRHAARSARRILTVSEFSRARLAACLPLRRDQIGLVPNAAGHLGAVQAQPAVLQRLGLVPQAYVLAVGSTNPSKNLAGLHDAFARLPRRLGLQLVIVGGHNPQVFAGGSGAAASPGAATAPGRVVYAGAITDAELKALYQQALLLAFPSLYEGFGLPPLEAMSCGCPVVAARAGAVPEVCGNAACLVEPGSAQALAEAIQRLADDPAERDRLRSAGLAHAAGHTWQHSAECLLQEMAALS